MVVAKFGGSSLADAQGFARVAKIIKDNDIPVVIVSAPGVKKSPPRTSPYEDNNIKTDESKGKKVTDLLIAAYKEWEKCGDCEGSFSEVRERLQAIASAFDIDISRALTSIKAAINSGGGYDYAVSRGEAISAQILADILDYNYIDAKDCVKLTLGGKIDFESIVAHSGSIKLPCVIPGFYGKMPNGEIKLLPRGGSDISGAAIAAALKGDYQKWTDVDGIFDGHGGVIDHLGYDEAEFLCYFGATVMHYGALPIIKKANVTLTIKNTFAPSLGTIIGNETYKGYAISSKRMFLGGNEAYSHIDEILSEGLKIPFMASLLGEKKILIDDCGFSPLAIKRILPYEDIKQVKVTAVVGKIPYEFSPLMPLYFGENGNIFIEEI